MSQITNGKTAKNPIEIPKLIYIGDPMCSWCWGISEQLEKLLHYFNGQFSVELIMGGLRIGSGQIWDEQFKQFLEHHWSQVSEASGQEFNFNLLDLDAFDYNTEPSCRAVRVVRDLNPNLEFQFFRSIQYNFYVKNEDPTRIEFYLPVCRLLGIDFERFSELFASDQYITLTHQDFMKSRRLGVTGYPTLLLQDSNEYNIITTGFARFEGMKSTIEGFLDH